MARCDDLHLALLSPTRLYVVVNHQCVCVGVPFIAGLGGRAKHMAVADAQLRLCFGVTLFNWLFFLLAVSLGGLLSSHSTLASWSAWFRAQ